MSAIRSIPALIALLIGAPVAAHHSFAAEFLEDVILEVEGTVDEVWFKNPHVRYYVKVVIEDGDEEVWDVRSASPTLLMRRGWTRDTIKEGDVIKITGHAGRDGRKLIQVITIELPDGSTVGERY